MKLTKKRGFSLVELMVVVAIMGTLAAIAIPAYNEYRKSAKKTAYRSDLLGLHKGWLAFGVELDSFCERETSPTEANISNVGMASLLSSKLYGQNRTSAACTTTNLGAGCTGCTLNSGQTDCTGTTSGCTAPANDGQTCAGSSAYVPTRQGPGKNNFIGFGAITCGTITTPVVNTHFMQDTSTDSNCDLTVATYDMGVFGHLAGTEFASFEVDNNGVVDEQTGLTSALATGGACAS